MERTQARKQVQRDTPDQETRIIFYVGKGGVGKTTLAATTAVRAAELGHRTLVVSTDIAHSLGDVLDTDLAAEPQQVAEQLFAQEINVLDEVRQSWGKVQSQMVEFLRREGVSEIQADELAILPGMEDVAALIQIGRKVRTGEFDCIVVDAAPTGETIRLLSMPESFQWYTDRMQDWRSRLTRYAGPIFRSALPELSAIDVMAKLAIRINELRGVFTNPRFSSYRIVVTPDRMVLKEAQRAETYLNIFEYPIDAVILNRVLALPDVDNAYIDALIVRQQRMITEIRNTFGTLPIFEAPVTSEEPIGIAALSAVARQIFGDRDPTAVMHVGPTQKIERRGNEYVLQMPMPNVEVEKLSLRKWGDALYIDLGTFRREITLPRALAALEPGTARVRTGMLEIPFVRALDLP